MLRAVLTLLPMLCPGVTCSPSDAMHRRRGHFQTPFRPYPGWTNGESWGASATSTGQKLPDHGCPSLCLSSCNYFEPCRAASWRPAVARHSWTPHWPWYVNYLLWSQRAHYGLCGAWGAFGACSILSLATGTTYKSTTYCSLWLHSHLTPLYIYEGATSALSTLSITQSPYPPLYPRRGY